MNRNSLLALATLIALLWIDGGDCQKGGQNENEGDIAKIWKRLEKAEKVECPESDCKARQSCGNDCRIKLGCDQGCNFVNHLMCLKKCLEGKNMNTNCYCKGNLKFRLKPKAEAEIADEDEADEAKSDEVDIAKRQKGLKILKARKRDEAEMADVEEADEDKVQN